MGGGGAYTGWAMGAAIITGAWPGGNPYTGLWLWVWQLRIKKIGLDKHMPFRITRTMHADIWQEERGFQHTRKGLWCADIPSTYHPLWYLLSHDAREESQGPKEEDEDDEGDQARRGKSVAPANGGTRWDGSSGIPSRVIRSMTWLMINHQRAFV